MMKLGYRNMKLIFTPITIVLAVLCLVFFVCPYNYFEANKTAKLFSGFFPIALVVLLPIDLVMRAFLHKEPSRLWFIEAVFLLMLGILIVLITQ